MEFFTKKKEKKFFGIVIIEKGFYTCIYDRYIGMQAPENHVIINDVMFEKISDEVNVTIELEDGTRTTTTSYTLDGKWKVEKEQQVVKKKVTAWQPLPDVYKPEEKSKESN